MMNMREMLGESGRTMSNIDREVSEVLSNRNIRNILGEDGKTMSNMDRTIAAGMGSPMMSDNEPRMEDRDQVFSIEADIQNLMKSYNMLVEAQEFDRAKQVADQINMLDVKKSQLQAINGSNRDTKMMEALIDVQRMKQMNPNRQPVEIQELLDSISI